MPEAGVQTERHASATTFTEKAPLFNRIWRTAVLATWSLLLGFGAGSGLITWAYLLGPFEAGTEEENELMDEITEMMNEYPAMEGLLNDPEWEEWPVAPRMVSGDSGKGLTFVTGTLTGSKGIVQVVLFICATSSARLTPMTMIEDILPPQDGGPDHDRLLRQWC